MTLQEAHARQAHVLATAANNLSVIVTQLREAGLLPPERPEIRVQHLQVIDRTAAEQVPTGTLLRSEHGILIRRVWNGWANLGSGDLDEGPIIRVTGLCNDRYTVLWHPTWTAS